MRGPTHRHSLLLVSPHPESTMGIYEGLRAKTGLGLAVLPQGSVSGPRHHRKEPRRLWAFRKAWLSISLGMMLAGFRVVLSLKANS